MQQAAHEGAAAQHHGAGGKALAPGGGDTGHATILHHDFIHISLEELQTRRSLQHPLHAGAVGAFVALGAGGAHAGALGGIQHAELNGRGIGVEPHGTAQGINLAYHVALCQAADGGVAAHLAHGVQVMREQGHGAAQTGGSQGCLYTGVTTANHQHIKYCRNE